MFFSKSLSLALPFAMAAVLAAGGCSQDVVGAPDIARWSPAEAPHENKVDFVTLSHTVTFAPNSYKLDANQAAALRQFLEQIRLGYSDQVTVDTGPRSSGVAAEALANQRVQFIAAFIHHANVETSTGRRTSEKGVPGGNQLLVAVGRYIVTTPVCPDWRKPEGDDYTNMPSSNFGCANETDLGMMVANPGDLVRGTATTTADGDFSARAIEQYRKGFITKSLAPELSGAVAGAPSSGGGLGTAGSN